MIHEGTRLKVADNSGAKEVECFNVLGGTNKRSAHLGDIVVVSVKNAEPRSSIRKRQVVRGVIVRQSQPYRRKDGSYISFDENAIILVQNQEPIGSRVFGPIAREIRERNFMKIISQAPEVL
ncbi:MAG: 50S ribosomal protein L14 [Parcubacteria group bacterium SW_4_49_11]|nr:MAG: 50S ribosomal protein L14 [Parcubacteria group bacterium SW_4_49_11]